MTKEILKTFGLTLFIVGDREEKEGTVAKHGKGGKIYGPQPPDKFIENIKKEIELKSNN